MVQEVAEKSDLLSLSLPAESHPLQRRADRGQGETLAGFLIQPQVTSTTTLNSQQSVGRVSIRGQYIVSRKFIHQIAQDAIFHLGPLKITYDHLSIY